MYAKDVMKTDIVSIAPETPVRGVIETLLDQSISGAPVVDSQGYPVGVVSLADCVEEAERGGSVRSSRLGFQRDLWSDLADDRVEHAVLMIDEDTLARDLMTPEPFTVEEDTLLGDVVDLMTELRIHRVLVMNKGSLSGIISTVDIMEALAVNLKRKKPTPV